MNYFFGLPGVCILSSQLFLFISTFPWYWGGTEERHVRDKTYGVASLAYMRVCLLLVLMLAYYKLHTISNSAKKSLFSRFTICHTMLCNFSKRLMLLQLTYWNISACKLSEFFIIIFHQLKAKHFHSVGIIECTFSFSDARSILFHHRKSTLVTSN